MHKVSRVWEFHFSFEEILPFATFQALKQGLQEEFSKTGNQAIFEIHVQNPTFDEELLQAYYREAFEEGPCASQGFKSVYKDLKVSAKDKDLLIEGRRRLTLSISVKIICLISVSS
ncbi:DNA polymerase III PolC [Streptococcus massiliensis]|uniref:DNA polymerase III PolC n=1 Tax=Streptococcus massiliensis TaxID=313439 RepID=A0A380KT41_9STRE|nr:DNA polymerase III PolC [Streptococcus massiliensis]